MPVVVVVVVVVIVLVPVVDMAAPLTGATPFSFNAFMAGPRLRGLHVCTLGHARGRGNRGPG